MKRKTLIFTIIIFTLSANKKVFAVAGDMAIVAVIEKQTALHTLKASADKAWQTVMQSNQVKAMKDAYDSYVQSKQYYDTIYELSKHKGGFLGYVMETTANTAKGMLEDEKQMFLSYKNGSSDNSVSKKNGELNTFLDKKMSVDEDFVSKQLNVSKLVENQNQINEDKKLSDLIEQFLNKSIQAAEIRDKLIEQTIKDANKPMKTNEMTETQVKLQVQQTQLLQSMDSANRMILATLNHQEEEKVRSKVREQSSSLSYSRWNAKMSGKMEKDRTKFKNPFKELQKLPASYR